MKGLSVTGVVVGLLALFIASAALVSTPEGAGDVKAELGKLKAELAKLGPELRTLKKEFAKASSEPDEASAKVEELTAQLAGVSGKIARLDRAVARAADGPEAGAAREAALSEGKVREIVREEVRAQLARSRGSRGGEAGRGGRDTTTALRERIGLDEEKAEKVTQALRKMGEDMRDIWRENRGGGREQIRELMSKLREKSEGEIAELLTPEEMEKFRDWRTETRRRWGGGRSGRRGRRDRGGGGGGGEEAGDPQPF